MQKEKNTTAQLKKISGNIEIGRKNIESDEHLIQNLHHVKGSFNELEIIIKGQSSSFQGMKQFTKQISSQSSKNLEVKRFFINFCEKSKMEFRQFLEVIKQNFVLNQKSKQKENWEKIQKQLEKTIFSIKQQSDSPQKIYSAVNRITTAKDLFFIQFFKLMMYKKNILWRDLNAPYDDYIHGDIKSVINLIKGNEEKFGYTPQTLEFVLPKFDIEHTESNLSELIKIILIDHSQLVEGLKNYSKLSDQPQVIEDISKNQHIVKGLRQKVELLTKNYEALMEKYRSLQISKGKVVAGSNEEKSLTDKIEEFETVLIKKQQELIEMKQNSLKTQSLMTSLRQKNKELEDELSKWHKYQLPKIKELQGNQRSILEEFNRAKRDIETYTNLVQAEREEKVKVIIDLKVQKTRVNELVSILGRQRRKIKQLKAEITKQEKIVMELVDKLPEN